MGCLRALRFRAASDCAFRLFFLGTSGSLLQEHALPPKCCHVGAPKEPDTAFGHSCSWKRPNTLKTSYAGSSESEQTSGLGWGEKSFHTQQPSRLTPSQLVINAFRALI